MVVRSIVWLVTANDANEVINAPTARRTSQLQRLAEINIVRFLEMPKLEQIQPSFNEKMLEEMKSTRYYSEAELESVRLYLKQTNTEIVEADYSDYF
jgi:hypothetical protein